MWGIGTRNLPFILPDKRLPMVVLPVFVVVLRAHSYQIGIVTVPHNVAALMIDVGEPFSSLSELSEAPPSLVAEYSNIDILERRGDNSV